MQISSFKSGGHGQDEPRNNELLMSHKMNTETDNIEIAMLYVRACGPVTAAEIENELLVQGSAIQTREQAKSWTARAIKHGMATGWMELYDGNPGEYVCRIA